MRDALCTDYASMARMIFSQLPLLAALLGASK
jgi:hypothetical protein